MSFSLFNMIALNGSSDAVDTVRLSLESASSWWFSVVKYAGYAVAAGCAMEAPETFVTIKRWWLLKFRDVEKEETTEEKKSWIVPLATVGLFIIVVGIVIETFAEVKVSDADALLRAHESDQITAAENNAASAIREAGNAKDSAKEAAKSSTSATGSATNAVNLASGARKEADSLESDIVSAKKQAADAVSRLADAEQRLADSTQREAVAEAKLSAIKTPRSLVQTNELIAALIPFKGTEYTVSVSQEDESIQFTKVVDGILQKAGWIRKQPASHNLGITYF